MKFTLNRAPFHIISICSPACYLNFTLICSLAHPKLVEHVSVEIENVADLTAILFNIHLQFKCHSQPPWQGAKALFGPGQWWGRRIAENVAVQSSAFLDFLHRSTRSQKQVWLGGLQNLQWYKWHGIEFDPWVFSVKRNNTDLILCNMICIYICMYVYFIFKNNIIVIMVITTQYNDHFIPERFQLWAVPMFRSFSGAPCTFCATDGRPWG